MRRNQITKFNVGTSKHDLMLKPYGFCCDIKDHDPTLRIKDPDSEPLFPHGVTGGGPDIKFRIQDVGTVSPSASRSHQKSSQRSGHRSGYRSGHEGGYRRSRQESGQRRSRQEGGNRGNRSGYQRGQRNDKLDNQDNRQLRGQSLRQRQGQGIYGNVNPKADGDNPGTTSESLDGPMICTRCRGPLRWYLEDEISVARDRMMGKRQDEYNAELDANVKIAMEKERKKQLKKKAKLPAK